MMTGGKYQLVSGGVATGEPFDLQNYSGYSNEGRGRSQVQDIRSSEEARRSRPLPAQFQGKSDGGNIYENTFLFKALNP
jgi:hypothetical protein